MRSIGRRLATRRSQATQMCEQSIVVRVWRQVFNASDRPCFNRIHPTWVHESHQHSDANGTLFKRLKSQTETVTLCTAQRNCVLSSLVDYRQQSCEFLRLLSLRSIHLWVKDYKWRASFSISTDFKKAIFAALWKPRQCEFQWSDKQMASDTLCGRGRLPCFT